MLPGTPVPSWLDALPWRCIYPRNSSPGSEVLSLLLQSGSGAAPSSLHEGARPAVPALHPLTPKERAPSLPESTEALQAQHLKSRTTIGASHTAHNRHPQASACETPRLDPHLSSSCRGNQEPESSWVQLGATASSSPKPTGNKNNSGNFLPSLPPSTHKKTELLLLPTPL